MVLKHYKILQIGKFYPPYMGGIETHLQILCENLKRSVNLEVLVANKSHKTIVEEINGVKVTRVGSWGNIFSSSLCPDLGKLIQRSNADLIHIHLPNPLAVMSYLRTSHKGKLVYSYHSDIVRQKILGKAFVPILCYALEKADAIVVATPKHIYSSSILSAFREKCKIIPYGIDYVKLLEHNDAKVDEIRQQYGKRIVLSIGRLVYYKGFELLIRSMKEIEAHLIIIGSGPLFNSLNRAIKKYGVADRVSILPDVADVRPFYHASTVFVLPSIIRSEAFGIVQAEAMACSKPVINTQLDSGVPLVSLDGITGLTVSPGSVPGLRDAINFILNNPKLATKFGQAGFERVVNEFCAAKMTGRILGLYSDLLG